jgi:tetratricopeptide (TPR) repeat protein
VASQLIAAEQYALANDFLETTAPVAPVEEPDLQLYRALATFHVSGASAALAELDQAPATARSGDYYLARFQMLAALGRSSDADAALGQAVSAAPKRAELYRQAAVQLIRNGQFTRALSLLDEAARNVPDHPDIQALKGIVLELGGKNSDGEFKRIESQWPEWASGWIAHAIVLEARQQSGAAQHCLDVAVELGGAEAGIAYCRNAKNLAPPVARDEFLAHGLILLFS